MYFRDSGGIVVDWGKRGMDPQKAVKPEELWEKLERNNVKFITVPHHPSVASHPCSWDFYNAKYDRLVEVYSCWGSSEYYGDFPRGFSDRYMNLDVRDALSRGLRMGLIASSDSHDGHPGNNVSRRQNAFHHLGSGRIAVLANKLSRHSIFDAMYERRCYATTGVPIILSFAINGRIIGTELPALSRAPVLKFECRGTNGIEHIRIIKNGKVADTIMCHGEFEIEGEWKDLNYSPLKSNYYYIRVVQVDKESAWSSPIWIG